MKISDFKHFEPYFSADEKWGNILNLKWHHVHHLFMIRDMIKIPMSIHCSADNEGHAPDSLHYQGLATDFHLRNGTCLERQYIEIISCLETLNLLNFVGVGVYPGWSRPGFHIDSRGSGLLWICQKNDYKYCSKYDKIAYLLRTLK